MTTENTNEKWSCPGVLGERGGLVVLRLILVIVFADSDDDGRCVSRVMGICDLPRVSVMASRNSALPISCRPDCR